MRMLLHDGDYSMRTRAEIKRGILLDFRVTTRVRPRTIRRVSYCSCPFSSAAVTTPRSDDVAAFQSLEQGLPHDDHMPSAPPAEQIVTKSKQSRKRNFDAQTGPEVNRELGVRDTKPSNAAVPRAAPAKKRL